MKTALLLSGALRNIEDTYTSIKYHLLDKLENIDVFIYGVENVDGKEKNEKLVQRLFKPKSIIINTTDFYNDIGCSILSVSKNHAPYKEYWNNSIRAFYNVYQVNKLKRQYEESIQFEYDVVIRTRFDLFWIRTLSKNEILRIKKGDLIIPYDWAFRINHPSGGRNNFGFSDLYAIGNSKIIDFYCDAYNYIEEFSTQYDYHPESVLGKYLDPVSVYETTRHVITDYPTDSNPYGPIGLFASDMLTEEKRRELELEECEFYSPLTWKEVLNRKRFDKK